MRVLDEERGYLDTVRERIANTFVDQGVEATDSDIDTLIAASRGVLAALRTSEVCVRAAEKDVAEDFATSYSRHRKLVEATGPLWRCSAGLFASATQWPGSGFGGLRYASLHHLVWAEVRTLHLLAAELACHEELINCDDSHLDLDPTPEKISASWNLIRRAILQSPAVDTSDAEIRLAYELAGAKAILATGQPDNHEKSVQETPTESDRDGGIMPPIEDGPIARRAWAHNGKMREGMPPKPWATAKCLFEAMPDGVDTATIAEEVDGANSLAIDTDIKNWQRDAKAFFKRNGIPLTISKSGDTFRMTDSGES